jgi:hypothetical protein
MVEDICRVRQGMENFIKGEYGAIETKGVVYFSLLIDKVSQICSKFCLRGREQLTQIRQRVVYGRRFYLVFL